MLTRSVRMALLLGLALATAAALQAQTARSYRTRLSPVPVPTFTPSITGVGSVTATLAGTTLTVAGTFEGLASPATAARIHKSPKPGIRGDALFNLTTTSGTSGTISGTFELTPAQAQELAASRYYVQLHSEKAPDGNLWGWLQPQEIRK